MNIAALHEKALSLSKTYRESESALLDVLMALVKDNGFFRLGYPNLFVYCTSALSLSEAQACYFSKVAKKSEEVPELKLAIEQGLISMSQARRVVPVITKETATAWIEKAAQLPQRELEREVCAVNPKAMPREKLKVVSEDRSELKVGISKDLEEKLKRVRELLGQDKSLESVLAQLTDFYLKHKDPVQKAKRVKRKAPKVVTPLSSGKSSAQVKHEVIHRDEGKCRALLPNGLRCDSKAWVEHHHVKPRSHGGDDTATNLITLCSAHHRLTHQTGLQNLRL